MAALNAGMQAAAWLRVCAGSGAGSSGSCIIMEFLEFGPRSDQAALGRSLAQMHLATPTVRPRASVMP